MSDAVVDLIIWDPGGDAAAVIFDEEMHDFVKAEIVMWCDSERSMEDYRLFGEVIKFHIRYNQKEISLSIDREALEEAIKKLGEINVWHRI